MNFDPNILSELLLVIPFFIGYTRPSYQSNRAQNRAIMRSHIYTENAREARARQKFEEKQASEAEKGMVARFVGKLIGGTVGFFTGGPQGAKVGWNAGGPLGSFIRKQDSDYFDSIDYLRKHRHDFTGKFNKEQDRIGHRDLINQMKDIEDMGKLTDMIDVGKAAWIGFSTDWSEFDKDAWQELTFKEQFRELVDSFKNEKFADFLEAWKGGGLSDIDNIPIDPEILDLNKDLDVTLVEDLADLGPSTENLDPLDMSKYKRDMTDPDTLRLKKELDIQLEKQIRHVGENPGDIIPGGAPKKIGNVDIQQELSNIDNNNTFGPGVDPADVLEVGVTPEEQAFLESEWRKGAITAGEYLRRITAKGSDTSIPLRSNSISPLGSSGFKTEGMSLPEKSKIGQWATDIRNNATNNITDGKFGKNIDWGNFGDKLKNFSPFEHFNPFENFHPFAKTETDFNVNERIETPLMPTKAKTIVGVRDNIPKHQKQYKQKTIPDLEFRDTTRFMPTTELPESGLPDGTAKSLDYIKSIAEGPGIKGPGSTVIETSDELFDEEIIIEDPSLEGLDDYKSPVTKGDTYAYDTNKQEYTVYDSTKTKQSPHKLYTKDYYQHVQGVEESIDIDLDSIDWTSQKEIDSLPLEVVEEYFKSFLATGRFKHQGTMYDIQEQISY